LQIDVGRRLAARDLLGRHGRSEEIGDAHQLQRSVDHRPIRRGGKPEGPAQRQPADRLDRAVDEREPVAVTLEHPLDDQPVQLVGRVSKTELLVHVARPLGRAHAHHFCLRAFVPPAASLTRESLAHFVPDLLGVEQKAVEIEDDGADQTAA